MSEYVRIYKFNWSDYLTADEVESLINEELTTQAKSVKLQTVFMLEHAAIIMVTFVKKDTETSS